MDHPDPTESPKSLSVIDPYTWAWFAEKAAGGLVSYAAGAALSSILGGDGLSASDVKSIVAAAVAEIKRHITQSLTQQTITEVQGRVNGCQELLRQYATNPSLPHRLEEADIEAQLALSTLALLGAPAITAYVNAATVKLLCVSAICLKDSSPAEMENYEQIARQGGDHISEACGAVAKSLQSRIDGVTAIREWRTYAREPGGPGSGSEEVWHAAFHDNGRERKYHSKVSRSQPMQDATRARDKVLSAYRHACDDFQQSVVSPSRKATADWDLALVELKKHLPSLQ